MSDTERFDEIDEEIDALHGACEQYEQAIGLLGELLTAVVMTIPRQGACYEFAAERIDRVLTARDAMPGRSLEEIPRRLAEQLRDDLRSFASLDGGPPPPNAPRRARFSIITGGRQ